MGPTLSLLAAGLLAAQTAEPSVINSGKTCPCQKNAASGPVQPVAVAPASTGGGGLFGFGLLRTGADAQNPPPPAEERPGFFQRLFGKTEKAEIPVTSEPPVNIKSSRQMQRLPSGPTTEPINQIPTSSTKVQPVTYQGVPDSSSIPAASIPTVPTVPPLPVSNNGSTIIKTADLPPSRPNRISPDLANKVGHETDYSWITGQIRIENGLYVIHYATPETIDRYNGSLVMQSDKDLRGFADGDFVSIRGSISGGANGRTIYRVGQIDRLPR